MYPWAGQHLAEAIVEHRRRYSEPMRGNSALASAIRHWLRLRRSPLLAPPPVARLLLANRDLAERIASGLEVGPVRPEAVRAVEQLLSDARPRKDDLRRAVFLVEAL
jgi:hypothetical protein